MKQSFNVTGMSCSACSAHVEKSVAKLSGVNSVSVNLLAASMKVDYDENVLSADDICQAVDHAGYGASPSQPASGTQTTAGSSSGTGSLTAAGTTSRTNPLAGEIKNMKFRLIVSFIFMIPLMYIAMGHMVGLPVPSILTGEEKCCDLCIYPASSYSAGHLCQS